VAANSTKRSMVKAIYGLVTVLPVLALMRDHPPAAWVAAAAVLGTTLAVALADGYSELIGRMLHRRSTLPKVLSLCACWGTA